jgi:predicted type IV restriction endonuclease
VRKKEYGRTQTVLELIERFDRNRVAYRSEQYNEARLRIEFLNPFFEALGWDVNNKQGYAEAYKDVIYEDAIKIGGATKAPDYCFRVGGTRKLFVEAKKPAINLKDASTTEGNGILKNVKMGKIKQSYSQNYKR